MRLVLLAACLLVGAGMLTVAVGVDRTQGGPAPTPASSPSPTTTLPPTCCIAQGNVDCSIGDVVNSVDALKVLRFSAALGVNQVEPCPDIGTVFLADELFGDVDCSSSVNSVDALKILRFAAGLPVQQIGPEPDSCVDIGEEFAVEMRLVPLAPARGKRETSNSASLTVPS